MKRVDVRKLSGGEILARDLYTLNYGTILMPKGTVLKKEYIDRLKLLGIYTVYIKDLKEKKGSSRCRNRIWTYKDLSESDKAGDGTSYL